MTRTNAAWGVLIFVFLTLGGCASVEEVLKAADIRDPRVSVESMQVQRFNMDDATVHVTLNVENPNPIAIHLAGFDYRLNIDERTLVQGSDGQALDIAALGQSKVNVPITLAFADVKNIAGVLANKDSFDYQVNVTAKINLPLLGKVSVPVEHRGNLPIPSFPELQLRAVNVERLSLSGVKMIFDVSIFNPNAFDLNIDSLRYDLELNGKNILAQNSQRALDVKSKSHASLTIPLELNFVQMGQGLYETLSNSGALNYRLAGQLDFATDLPQFNTVTFPFEQRGSTRVTR